MSAEQDWPRLFELFEHGIEVPPSGRSAWLDQVAAANPALRRELERLFRGHDRQGLLDQPLTPGDPDVAGQLEAALGDRYLLRGPLGRGGSAIVFLAEETKHARPVVIKVLDPVVAAAAGPERFRQEVRIAATLSHPHILGLIDSGESHGLFYYVMPYIEGETLRARLDRRGTLPLAEACPILRDIAQALSHAHSRRVVHRDLKPENVLLSGEHPYLMDFGVAKLVTGNAGVQLTLRGHVVGTPAYMAPEQRAASFATDERADVYSWGLLAHEMLTGRAPAIGTVRGQRLALPGVPPAMCQLLSDALVTEPGERVGNAGELLRRLAEVPGGVSDSGLVVARRRPLRTAAIVVTVALLAALGYAALRSRGAVHEAISLPIAVTSFRNETGDTTLNTWGRMMGDWITQGLQETGLGSVVPWPAVLQAESQGRDVGAGTVVSGSYYLAGDSLHFRAEVVDARSGHLLSALPPVATVRAAPGAALEPLRERVMGTYAVLLDERLPGTVGVRQRPPTFEAYQAFDAGMRRFVDQDYAEAVPHLKRAFQLDTTFVSPLLTLASSWWNEGEMDSVGVALDQVRLRQGSLSAYFQLWYEAFDAFYNNDYHRAYSTLQQAAELAPDSRAGYNMAVAALGIDRPAEALAALELLDPDQGHLSNWSSYWSQLAHARHLLGQHREELTAARSLASRFPDRRVALAYQVRALAALRDTAAIDSLLRAAAPLPPSTYWSQGAAMVVAGEELLAHGYPASSGRYLEQAVAWCTAQLALEPGQRVHRAWLGTALYNLGRWREARAEFESLHRDFPARRDYHAWVVLARARATGRNTSDELRPPQPWSRGANLFTQGRIAAATRDRERAMLLFNEAVGLGIESLPWLHATAARDLLELGQDRARLPRSLRAGLPPSQP